MKYEVIGWTSDSDPKYPHHKTITECVERAIIEEIRKHGYCFGGDAHEEYCPVLNDGTLVSYSWRGWGRVMARAWGTFDDGYDYMQYYMNMLIKEDCISYPKPEVDDSRIVPKETLKETFVYHLEDAPFDAIRNGKKRFEIRLFDEKRKLMDIGDSIRFVRVGHEEDSFCVTVRNMIVEPGFKELFTTTHWDKEKEKLRSVPRFDPEVLGFGKTATVREMVLGMRQYYSEEDEKKYGVIAIEISDPEQEIEFREDSAVRRRKRQHTCKTYFSVCFEFDVARNAELLKARRDCSPEEIGIFRKDEVEAFIKEAFGVVPRWDRHHFVIGYNDTYDIDVNQMLHVTLKDLFGKQDQIRELQQKFPVTTVLEIIPHIIADSEEPKQCLSPDRDILDFLSESGTALDLDYYIF